MNIVGIGTDIVECVRIAQMIEKHGELFLERVFTAREMRYCQSRKHATEHFAGRWAAKEAILKCLGTGWRKGICWTDMEIRNDPQGAPHVYLAGVAKEQAQKLAITDELTGIYNGRYFRHFLSRIIEKARVMRFPVTTTTPYVWTR